MIYGLNIAGVSIDIISQFQLKRNKKLESFADGRNREADIKIRLLRGKILSPADHVFLTDDHMEWYYYPDDNNQIYINIYNQITDNIMYQLIVNRQWKEASITYSENTTDLISAFTGPLGEIVFRNRILYHQGIVIHSAAIEWEGKGIMFSAPSGTGKSTQAKLWRKFRGAIIINEDRPAVCIQGEQVYVCGTVWNGSSEKSRNRKAALAAIVLLEQSEENSIQRLSQVEGLTKLMPRCFLPYHDANLMNHAIDNLEQVTDLVPVYLLRCRPDKEAVEMLYQCVK